MTTEATTLMMSAAKVTDDPLERVNWAIDQTTAWMLELTRLKIEIEQGKQERHLTLVK
jgi:hypothetical protein